MLVGGEVVTLLHDESFAKLRAVLGYDAWLPSALVAFDWKKMSSGGGKGGNHMARTPCKRLFVKGVSTGDAATLADPAFLKAYVARLSTGKSLIVHIVAHFTRPNGDTCLVMNNWLPPDAGLTWHRVYDLKGTADDKTLVADGKAIEERHKRWFNLHWLAAEACCGKGASSTPPERRRYALGKVEAFNLRVVLTAAQRSALLASLRDDAAFLGSPLAAGGCMDYSLLVGVLAPPPGDGPAEHAAVSPPDGSHAAPLASRSDGALRVFYIGIIDILQRWTASKKIAHGIKACCAPHPISTVPPASYARQFAAHFEDVFLGTGSPAWVQMVPSNEPAVVEAVREELFADEAAVRSAAAASAGAAGAGGAATGGSSVVVGGTAVAAAAGGAGGAAAGGGGSGAEAEGEDEEFHDALGRMSGVSGWSVADSTTGLGGGRRA